MTVHIFFIGVMNIFSQLKPMHWMFIGSSIILIGTAINIYAAFLHNKSSSEKTSSIKSTSEKTGKDVESLLAENKTLKEAIDTLKSENGNLRKDLNEKTTILLNNQTGGDGFVVLEIYPMNDDEARLYMKNHSDLPMYDIDYRVWDIDFMKSSGKTEGEMKERLENFKTRPLGNVPPKGMKDLGILKGDFRGSKKMFFIDIDAKNGGLHQETGFRREPNIIDGNRAWPDHWYYQTRLFRKNKLIFEGTNAPEGYVPNE
jgi:hypothetical protein